MSKGDSRPIDRPDGDDAYVRLSGIDGWLSQQQVRMVPISSLLPSDSPRLAGENDEHANALAESAVSLPPIVVHRSTMRVIDGMHRLRAATLRGENEVAVRFYDGGEADAFVLAVEMNVAHGLPLSLADRRAAASRIVESHPQWSDSVVASATGLSDRTVAALRPRSTKKLSGSNTRIGRDGRVRPLNNAAARALAGELMAENPDASLREIAKAAGISPSTAWDVRNRLRHGNPPVPTSQRQTEQMPDRQPKSKLSMSQREPKTGNAQVGVDKTRTLQRLRNDPALRLSEAGRALLRWLHAHSKDVDGWARLIDDLPAHCATTVASLARENANSWRKFAEHLEQRERTTDRYSKSVTGAWPEC
jgi:ParB-like chromosome segregation protein Spo0J